MAIPRRFALIGHVHDMFLVDPDDPTRKNQFDNKHLAPLVMDIVHHEIHEGGRFIIHEGIVLNNAAKEYLIQTPDSNKESHFTFIIDGSLDFSVRFYEDTEKTTGTAMTAIDHNRGTANTADTVVTHSPGGTEGSSGLVLLTGRHGNPTTGGGKGGEGGQSGDRDEFVLKTNTKYSLIITALSANDNNITVDLDWYEHTPE